MIRALRANYLTLAKIFFAGVVIVVYASLSSAQESPPRKKMTASYGGGPVGTSFSESRCPADVPQHTLVHCMQDEAAGLDRQVLNRMNESVLAVAKADILEANKEQVKRNLIDVQQAWEVYRKRDCENRIVFLDDSDSAKLEYWDCWRKHAQRRLDDFELFTVR